MIVTTPNVEYNVRFETLPVGHLRHKDHRFEWTREQFQTWAKGVAERFGYAVEFKPIGPEDAEIGPPTQMGVFAPNDLARFVGSALADADRRVARTASAEADPTKF